MTYVHTASCTAQRSWRLSMVKTYQVQ